jgi:putative transposase
MRLSSRYRLNPTKSQRTALNATLDACRWVYNNTLATRKGAWEQRQESVSKYDTVKMLPEWKAQHEWLQQAYSQTLHEVCNRVDRAFQAFFRRVKSGEKEVVPRGNPPRFRGKGWYDSFTFPACEGWKLEGDTLRIFKVGRVKLKLHRPINGEIKTLTIRRDTLGNWYACFSCEVEWIAPEPSPYVVGIDMGLEKFATLSTTLWVRGDD